MLDWTTLAGILKRQKKDALLELLEQAFLAMEPKQQRAVFGELAKKPPTPRPNAAALLEDVVHFEHDSLARKYYQGFSINSKNWTHIPEKTREWFRRIGELLNHASALTRQGAHTEAAACFDRLFALIQRMESGDEIVFADEYGSWMIPVEEKTWIAEYLTSLAAIATPEEFAAKAIALVDRDGLNSFAGHAFKSALKVASKEQAARLKAEIARQKIRTGPEKRR